jgi:hypothetical protein
MLLTAPKVPLMSTLYVPATAVWLAANVSVLLPEGAMVLGLKLADMPVGNPVIVSDILPPIPVGFVALIMVAEFALPLVREIAACDAAIPKLAAGIVICTIAVFTMLPKVPFTVTV